LKYSVITFGCRVNQADSLNVEEDLRAHGAIASEADEADVVVVNTCSVTASADQAARQTIRRIARLNPDAKIVVTGCYATRRPDEVVDLPGVARVVPNDDKPQLISIVRSVRPSTSSGRPEPVEGRLPWPERERRQADLHQPDLTTSDRFGDGDGSCGAALEPGMAGRTAFTLRVQTGCAEECSYCIIPTTRGRPRSVPIETVLAEVGRVRAAGFDRRPPGILRPRSATAVISSGPPGTPRLQIVQRPSRIRPSRTGGSVPHQLARADGLHAANRGPCRGCRVLGAALPSAAAACEQPYAGGDATALHD
jgi:tRNA A37 methylthiotransferase MiaB